MKFTITPRVPHAALRDHVPRPVHGRLPPGPPAGGAPYTLVVFTPKRTVVNSGLVARALGRLPAGEPGPLLVVGPEFTAEAYALLHARGAEVVTERDWHWTDASHARIGVLAGARVKAPQHR